MWTNKHKSDFIETVLLGYPFPEIYIAVGEVDSQTGRGTEILVDGQQRMTTLYQYFSGSDELKLVPKTKIKPFLDLTEDERLAFLQYEVVIRDLGKKTLDEIREIFKRINSTNYALNAMEIHNSRFEGEFKAFGERLSQDSFFERHHVFSPGEIRRMQDVRFALVFVMTIMSSYTNRDGDLEMYLDRYNDAFEFGDQIQAEVQKVLDFIDRCELGVQSRAWNKADLFTLMVELHGILIKDATQLDAVEVGERLRCFFSSVEEAASGRAAAKDVAGYYKAAIQANNDRSSRITRGRILRSIILAE